MNHDSLRTDQSEATHTPWRIESQSVGEYLLEDFVSEYAKGNKVIVAEDDRGNGAPLAICMMLDGLKDGERDANAAFIVEACNSYAAHLAAMSQAEAAMEAAQGTIEPGLYSLGKSIGDTAEFGSSARLAIQRAAAIEQQLRSALAALRAAKGAKPDAK